MTEVTDCLSCTNRCVSQEGTKIVLGQKRVLECAYSNQLPQGDLLQLLSNIEEISQNAASVLFGRSIGSGSINNCRGAWLENIIGSIFWNVVATLPDNRDSCLIKLPNATNFSFIDLLEPDAKSALESGLLRTLEQQNIQMHMSIPDFIFVNQLPDDVSDNFHVTLGNLSILNQELMSNSYHHILNQCRYDALKFAVSVKSSLRPDRRYQVIHEGNTVKALIAHLQVRFWDTGFQTNFYVMCAGHVSDQDRNIMRSPATHSITDVHARVIPAVDEIFEIHSTQEVEELIKSLIQSNTEEGC